MPSINIVTQSEIVKTPRVKQLEAMFDAPTDEVVRLEWQGELPIEDESWNVGLIVGASGNRLRAVPGQRVPSASALGGRPSAVFSYQGDAMDKSQAQQFLAKS